MTDSGNELLDLYFDWLVNLICSGKYANGLSWRRLFRLLHEMEFVYILDLDGNRADDGIDLRYQFAYENGFGEEDINAVFESIPCSMLEMMVALSQRCETHIMDDPEAGDRTGKWFFEMIESLGLLDMDDKNFDKIAAADILIRFMRREYLPNGQGGLFTIHESEYDLRDMEIWYQMMHYLNEYLSE